MSEPSIRARELWLSGTPLHFDAMQGPGTDDQFYFRMVGAFRVFKTLR